MRSLFALLLVLSVLAACAVVLSEAAPAPSCSPACRLGKSCCFDTDTVGPPAALDTDARCYNFERSDDHCGSCDVHCDKGHDAAFDRCDDGSCGTDWYPLERKRRNCDGSQIITPPPGFITVPLLVGSVQYARTSLGTFLTAYVSVTNATPGIYHARLIQVKSGDPDCPLGATTLTVNGAGVGTVTLSEPLLAGSTSAFVYFNHQSNADLDQFGSETVPTVI